MTRPAMGVRGLLLLGAAIGCGQETATASLRALDIVGDVSLVCLARDSSGAFTRGLARSECPDYEFALSSVYNRRLHALVTQPASGEVALVDLAVDPANAVVDYEPSQPGYSFIPVGAEPVSIVSTPGGVASFVGVREPGREGIFGLPSSCLAPRAAEQPLRDLRTWPACRLPAPPGPMVMLVDPAVDADGDPATPPGVRATCESSYVDPSVLVGQAPAAARDECAADLASEMGPVGRRKLAVALPSLSEVWILDAQALLDRAPGSYDVCEVEQRLPLGAEVTSAAQQLPPDLETDDASCNPVGLGHGPAPEAYRPWPSDFALDDEQRLYVADSQAPLIHVLDVTDPCAVSPLPALEPRSFLDPGAVITSRRVAVSQLTPLGQRFVYAIDNSTTITAGTLMAFDVSPGATDRTPIVRPRSALNPTEPPDRIAIGRDVADVEFVYQDFPEPANGVAIEGVACDPDPALRVDSPAAEYRPSGDLSIGANPRKLRGTFAFAALHSGQIVVIDVEDLDAACRRPVRVNPGATEDIYGCQGDPDLENGYRANGIQTVSNELSCNIVAPHRLRSRNFFTSVGLLAFPQLTLQTGRSVTPDQSDDGLDYPKLLAARHAAGQPGALAVGPIVYNTDDPTSQLDVDPATAERTGLLLSYEEPRAYNPGEEFTLTYEGAVRQVSEALIQVDTARGLGVVNEGLNAALCSAGIQDMAVVADVGRDLGVTDPEALASFSRRHADYVQIVSDLLDEDDTYWVDPARGGSCGLELFANGVDTGARLSGRPLCEQFFGPIEVQDAERDFRVVEAREDYLLVEPRSYDPAQMSETRRRLLSEFAACCFPGPVPYQVRAGHQWVVRGSASGFTHGVITDPESLRCVADCSPLAAGLRSRAFEIACSEDCPTDAQQRPPAGYAVAGEDFACVVDSTDNGVDPGEPGSQCVFQNLTTRFAVYRGQEPSRRDMRFRWQLSDGFNPLVIGLTSVDRARSIPDKLISLPEANQLIVSDGSARGLTFVSSRTLGSLSSIF